MKTHDTLARPRAHQRNLVRRPAFGEMTVLVIFSSKSLCNFPSCQIPKLVLLYNCQGEIDRDPLRWVLKSGNTRASQTLKIIIAQ